MPFEDDRRQWLPLETELQRARRHLRTTHEVLARQEAIVADMEAHHSRALWIGRDLLEIMRRSDALAQRYVTFLEQNGIR